MSAKAPAKGHTVKHTKTSKAGKASAKHRPNHHKKPATAKAPGRKVTAKAKHPAHAKAVGFAVGDLLPVCAFEAVAQSLRLAGQFVHDDEVAGLWDLLGAPPLGASVPAALDAASVHGLARFRPRWERVAVPVAADHLALPFAEDEAVAVDPFEDFLAAHFHGLILGVDVPGPHAVLATADGWWSWGELYDPWPCTVSEAWAVSWS